MEGSNGIGGLGVAKDEITSSKYDFFSPVYINKDVRKSHIQTYYPNSAVGSMGPFTFEIPADPGKFVIADSLRLHGRMRIRKKGISGTLEDLSVGDKISTVNNVFDSL